MTVWAISASGPDAQKNYPKTLTKPISIERLKNVRKYLGEEHGEFFAWGFPVNSKGKTNHKNMEEGDICFLLCDLDGEGRGTYQFAARVRRVMPKGIAAEVSQAFWDSPDFLPYLIDKPIRIDVPPEEFGRSLNDEDTYMAESPQGSQRIADEKRAAPAIQAHGSLEEWALDLIEKESGAPLKEGVEIALGFDDKLGVLEQSSEPLLSAKRKPNAGGAGGYPRHTTRRAKAIGDLGERAVLNYLSRMLPPDQAKTLRWVANLGEKPGYDIEYYDGKGAVVGVEVKSTITSKFTTFDMTVNELECAHKLEERYHLYLVANCLNPNRRVFEVIANPAKELGDRLLPCVYHFV